MSKFSTIHVFGYGETQMIGSGVNQKVKSADLTTLPAFVDYVKSKKPADLEESNYHVIHVFDGTRVDFGSAERKKSFSIKWEDLDVTTLDALVTEIEATIPQNA